MAFVVEEFIQIDPTSMVSYPAIYTFIAPDGTLEVKGISNMFIGPQGAFEGVTIDSSLMDTVLTNQILEFNKVIGQLLSYYGYKGFYNIDFIVSDTGKLYATEVNIRRSGGTHVIDIKNHLGIVDRCICAWNSYTDPIFANISEASLRKLIYEWAYNRKRQEGIIITMISGLKHGRSKIGIMAIASNYSTAMQIKQNFIAAAKSITNG